MIGYAKAFGSTLVIFAVAVLLVLLYRRLDRLRVVGDTRQ